MSALRPAVIVGTVAAAVVVGLLGACGVAWAQDAAPPMSAGLSDIGAGAGGVLGALAAIGVGLREIANGLRNRDARGAAAEAEAEADKKAEAWRRDLAAIDARHFGLVDKYNGLDKAVGRLEERLVAQAAQGQQLHNDLQGIGNKLDAIRGSLPPRP